MSQNYIPIYDDTVVKMSIKQGLEEDRTAGKDTDAKNLPGYFTIGELAFTRDTYRVFCGNVTNDTEREYQTTLGGSIVGNKYLGLIDSNPNTAPKSEESEEPEVVSEDSSDSSNTIPHFDYKDIKDSSYFQNGDDGYWDVTSSYNETYGAYKGDFIYDSYRNGLILFDDKIKDAKPYGDPTSAVYDFTSDMFGDGYVILYNLIPDGDTITLEDRILTTEGDNVNTTGTTITENNNYNILKINKVTTTHLDNGGCFYGENITGINNYIDLASTIKVDAIDTRTERNYLSLPSHVTFGNFLSLDTDDLKNGDKKYLCIDNSKISLADSNIDINDFSFTLNLGEGLTTSDDGAAIKITNGGSATIDIIPQVEKEEEKKDIGNRCLTYFKNPYTLLETNDYQVCCRFASDKNVYSTFIKSNEPSGEAVTKYSVIGWDNGKTDDEKVLIWPGKLVNDDIYESAYGNIIESHYSVTCFANGLYDDDGEPVTTETLPLAIIKEGEKNFKIKYTKSDGTKETVTGITKIEHEDTDITNEDFKKYFNDEIKVKYTDSEVDGFSIEEIYKKDGSCNESFTTFKFTTESEVISLIFPVKCYIWGIEKTDEYELKLKTIQYDDGIVENISESDDYKINDEFFLLKNETIKNKVKENKLIGAGHYYYTPIYKIKICYEVTNNGKSTTYREIIDLNDYGLIHTTDLSELDDNDVWYYAYCRYVLNKHKDLPGDYDGSTMILPEIQDDATSVILNYEWSGNTQDVKCDIGYMYDFDTFPTSIEFNTSYGIDTASTTDFTYNIKNENFVSDAIIPLIRENTNTSSKTFEIPITEGADGYKYFCLYASEDLTIKLLGYRV